MLRSNSKQWRRLDAASASSRWQRAVKRARVCVLLCTSHDHSSPGIKSQGHRSRSRARLAVGLTIVVDWGQKKKTVPVFTCVGTVGANDADHVDMLTARQSEGQADHVTRDPVTWHGLQVHDVATVEAQVEHRETACLLRTRNNTTILRFYFPINVFLNFFRM